MVSTAQRDADHGEQPGMRRYFIIVGDKTTSNGTVLEGEERVTIHGKAQACHGARIYCPTCKSEGRIAGAGPSRPHTLHGKQAALENDLCICKCDPPPRLLASQHYASMSFDSEELCRMGYAPDGSRLASGNAGEFDRHFRFVDEHGQPVSGIRVHLTDVDGQTSPVTTDSNGRTPVRSGTAQQRIGVSLREVFR